MNEDKKNDIFNYVAGAVCGTISAVALSSGAGGVVIAVIGSLGFIAAGVVADAEIKLKILSSAIPFALATGLVINSANPNQELDAPDPKNVQSCIGQTATYDFEEQPVILLNTQKTTEENSLGAINKDAKSTLDYKN